MTTIVELYEALKAAGAPEDKAQAAAKALAALEVQVTMVKWISGATFAGVLVLDLEDLPTSMMDE